MQLTNTQILAKLIEYLGINTNEPEFKQLLKEQLEIKPRVFKNNDTIQETELEVNPSSGLRLTFYDKAIFWGELDNNWYQSGFIFNKFCLFSDSFEDVDSVFTQGLPFELQWHDTRSTVQAKMQQQATNKLISGLTTDIWQLNNVNVAVTYDECTQQIDILTLYLSFPQIPAPQTVQAVDIDNVMAFLDKSITNEPAFWDLWQNQFTKKEIKEILKGEVDIDLTEPFGLEMTVSEKNRKIFLKKITLYANRTYLCAGWQGRLPYDLTWQDTPMSIEEELCQRPREFKETYFTGKAIWDLPTFTMKVLFNMPEYRLNEIVITPPFHSRIEKSFNPNIPMPKLLEDFERWASDYEYSDLGYFEWDSNFVDDHWIENGSKLASQFALWLRLPEGSTIGFWRSQNFNDDDILPVVLLGSEGDLSVLADSLEEFLYNWANGGIMEGCFEFEPDEEDEDYDDMVANQAEMLAWLESNDVEIPEVTKTVATEDLEQFFDAWQKKQKS